MRPSIGGGRKFEAVPVDGDIFAQLVVDVKAHALTAAHVQRRPQVGGLNTDRLRSCARDKFLLTRSHGQAEGSHTLLDQTPVQGWNSERIALVRTVEHRCAAHLATGKRESGRSERRKAETPDQLAPIDKEWLFLAVHPRTAPSLEYWPPVLFCYLIAGQWR